MAYYVDEQGNVQNNENVETIMIPTAGDLDKLPQMTEGTIYMPGLIAHTPGYGRVWQMKNDGTWQEIG